MKNKIPVRLTLEDGTVYTGKSFGANIPAAGEVVFNTAMTGYPESLTDPSYRGQILCLTYPLVGNYGAPGKEESDDILRFHESSSIHISSQTILLITAIGMQRKALMNGFVKTTPLVCMELIQEHLQKESEKKVLCSESLNRKILQ
jgi:carbamoylphosphate synthase small subunit